MLILPIKKKWFDMIVSGEKKEEYREIKPYWSKRFVKNIFGSENITNSDMKCFYEDVKTSGNSIYAHVIKIIFRNGYKKDSPQLKCKCKLRIGQGKEEWGAEKRERVLHIRDIKSRGGISYGRNKSTENMLELEQE